MNTCITSALRAGLEDLTALGTTLLRTFNTAPFLICSRLTRTIRMTLSPADIWKTLEPDTHARADAMLRDVRALHFAVAGLPGVDLGLTAKLLAVGDALLDYRASLSRADTSAALVPA